MTTEEYFKSHPSDFVGPDRKFPDTIFGGPKLEKKDMDYINGTIRKKVEDTACDYGMKDPVIYCIEKDDKIAYLSKDIMTNDVQSKLTKNGFIISDLNDSHLEYSLEADIKSTYKKVKFPDECFFFNSFLSPDYINIGTPECPKTPWDSTKTTMDPSKEYIQTIDDMHKYMTDVFPNISIFKDRVDHIIANRLQYLRERRTMHCVEFHNTYIPEENRLINLKTLSFSVPKRKLADSPIVSFFDTSTIDDVLTEAIPVKPGNVETDFIICSGLCDEFVCIECEVEKDTADLSYCNEYVRINNKLNLFSDSRRTFNKAVDIDDEFNKTYGYSIEDHMVSKIIEKTMPDEHSFDRG